MVPIRLKTGGGVAFVGTEVEYSTCGLKSGVVLMVSD